MAKSLEQILGYVYLTGLVEDIKTGIPKVIDDKFWSLKSETYEDQGLYTRFSGTRKVARRAEYGSGARNRGLSAVGEFPIKLSFFNEYIELKVKQFQSLRNYADYNVQKRGIQEVQRQALQFRTLFDNNRVALVHSMLANGDISWDSDGELLPSTSGAALTVDYGVSANNKTQANGLIAASWATASTDIPLHLRGFKQRSLFLTGYEVTTIVYGKNIPSYLVKNDFVKDYMARNPTMNEKWVTSGEIPDGLFDFKWVPAYRAFFEDSAGTNQTWWGDDEISLYPDLDQMLYELMEGTYPIPKSYAVTNSLEGSMNAFEIKTGMASWGIPIFNPPTAQIHYVDTVMPIWKVPDAIFVQIDVTP